MKKYLLVLPVMLFCTLTMRAQSIKFSDLVFLTTLPNDAVYNNMIQGNAFRQDYSEDVNGQQLEYFKSIGAKPNAERITVGH